jgi:hypothetical protein
MMHYASLIGYLSNYLTILMVASVVDWWFKATLTPWEVYIVTHYADGVVHLKPLEHDGPNICSLLEMTRSEGQS